MRCFVVRAWIISMGARGIAYKVDRSHRRGVPSLCVSHTRLITFGAGSSIPSRFRSDACDFLHAGQEDLMNPNQWHGGLKQLKGH